MAGTAAQESGHVLGDEGLAVPTTAANVCSVLGAIISSAGFRAFAVTGMATVFPAALITTASLLAPAEVARKAGA